MGQKSNMYLDVQVLQDEVTGSCIYCDLRLPSRKVKFLIDCGLFQEREYLERNQNLPFQAQELSYVFLTHIHTDHCGRIPLLYRNGYRHKVHMTHLSKLLLPVSLKNTCKIFEQTKRHNEIPLYNENDVTNALKNICSYNYQEMIQIDENISVVFLSNGHLFGAASIYMKISYPNEEDINIIFSGDYAPHNAFFHVLDIPEEIKNSRVTIIQESTYGTTKSDDIEFVLKDHIKQAIEKKKSILLPAFSIGRYQLTLSLIKKWQKEKIIPNSYKIYLDGTMPLEYNEILTANNFLFKSDMRNFIPKNSYLVQDQQENKDSTKKKKKTSKNSWTKQIAIRDKVIESKKPKIVVSSSGMGSYGPVFEYLSNWLSNENVLIHFLGYMAEGTLGRSLQETQIGSEFLMNDGQMVKKYAQIEFTSELSSHAKQDELLAFLDLFQKINCLCINHGNTDVTEEYARICKKQNKAKDVVVFNSKTTYRIGAYGFIKSFQTVMV